MIDRIRLTAIAKNQLSTIKRRTGIEHYNSICRYALCLSLANGSRPPEEDFNFNGGLEIEWRVLTSGNDALYLNMILTRIALEEGSTREEDVKRLCVSHIHRGLSYLVSDEEALLKLPGIV
ncbi:DNA sulfur modification protein DndE [Ectopseudomonas khazarica]|uniref:DNA sulfur modification protein DndE n=1 Tax=Ectopseudomonas khazarica TaxID=2502979 RepID=UPI00384BCF37